MKKTQKNRRLLPELPDEKRRYSLYLGGVFLLRAETAQKRAQNERHAEDERGAAFGVDVHRAVSRDAQKAGDDALHDIAQHRAARGNGRREDAEAQQLLRARKREGGFGLQNIGKVNFRKFGKNSLARADDEPAGKRGAAPLILPERLPGIRP